MFPCLKFVHCIKEALVNWFLQLVPDKWSLESNIWPTLDYKAWIYDFKFFMRPHFNLLWIANIHLCSINQRYYTYHYSSRDKSVVISGFEEFWWRHQVETTSALLATGEFSAQRPVTRSFEVFFDLPLNKRLSTQSWGWWFDTPSWPLWRHCNVDPRRIFLVPSIDCACFSRFPVF